LLVNKFIFITSITVIIPLIAALVNPGLLFKKNKWLFLYLIVAVITESVCLPLSFLKKNNLGIYSVYTIAEFGFLSLALVNGSKQFKRLYAAIIMLSFALAAITIWELSVSAHGSHLTSVSITSELLLLIGFSLYVLHRIMEDREELYIHKSARFWLAASVLVYAAGSFFFYLADYYFSVVNLTRPQEYAILHSLLNFIFQLLLTKTVACYLNKTQAG
jgi:hypothetical protein